MTQSQVQCFLSVVDNSGFSKAAEHLIISQPAVSKQISLLESEFGFALFDRTRKGSRLTSAGEIMYKFFRGMNKQYNAAVDEARRLSVEHTSSVRIGCLEGWDLSDFYPSICTYFEEKYPKIQLSIEGFSFNEMNLALLRGDVDVAISLGISLRECPNVKTSHLTSAGSILIYSARHPKADKVSLTLQDFKDDLFFIVAESENHKPFSNFTRKYCAVYGFEPMLVNIPSLSSAFLKIQSGLGVLFSDDWMMAKSNPLFRYLPTGAIFDIHIGWVDDGANSVKELFVNESLLYFKQQNASPPYEYKSF